VTGANGPGRSIRAARMARTLRPDANCHRQGASSTARRRSRLAPSHAGVH